MGLLDMIMGGRQGSAPTIRGFRSSVQITDGDAAYNTAAEVIALITAAAHTDYLKIWAKTVESQMRYAWGFGSAALPHNQGYMWFASLDAAADWDVGVLRIEQRNARETMSIVVAEIPDSRLHTATVTTLATATPINRNEMIALPEKIEYPLVKEDSLLVLTYRLNTAATTHDVAGFDIPVTIYQ